MSTSILAAVLFGAFLHAVWNVSIRAASDKTLTTILVAGGAGIWTACWLPFAPLPGVGSWLYLAISVLVHILYFSFIAHLYRHADLSFTYPIMRGAAPALSAIAAMAFVHEVPERNGWTGVILVSVGIILLIADTSRSGSLRFSTALLALANAGVIVIYTLVDGVGARLSGHPTSYTGWLFFLTAIPLVAMYLAKHGQDGAKKLRLNWQQGVIGGACSVGSYGLALWAMTEAPIALVAALRETSVVFGIAMGAVFLGEQVSPVRYVSALVVTGGAVAIKMS